MGLDGLGRLRRRAGLRGRHAGPRPPRARAIDSARKLGLEPKIPAEEIAALAVEGVGRFPEGTELYIRPLFWADDGFVEPEAESTRFMLTLFELPLPAPDDTVTAAVAEERRPRPGHGADGRQGLLPLSERAAHAPQGAASGLLDGAGARP